ncbi:selenium-dependent xanthine dehydrogenase [Miniphocaeibacter halophilus]|uniref:Selenium-dependent xanthine dehydrogenase n=1 Tax=Miniphocaeibacter halophilus TaxID=2931922 RepID=A0AC61MRJ5_9FIRM|nr:selenium-dependent xanthine dehydrogenase [Miniphocaeibacter halophilus]QQK08072.1 selenium-dependent xanthine dehydrogenase [Miniphocaeibacter halophilus]
MYKFKINGKGYEYSKDISLLTFLRDNLSITSVKNGCNQGACGTCSVLVDSRVMKACVVRLSKVENKSVITVEGLSSKEKEIYTYAFGKTGAVQCGFCIPGMVIAAKGLIDQNPNPTRDDVKKAIRGNICRCTGYVKIEDAILLAAEIFRDNKTISKENSKGKIGEEFVRVDAKVKTLGVAKYVDDIVIDEMVYGKAIRLPIARAKILSIDKSKALEHPGVLAVYTAEDIPGERYIGHLQKDWPVLIAEGEETRYIGDAVALIVTKTKEQLKEASKLVRIDYEELEPITNPFDSMKEGAYEIHKKGFNQFGNHYIPKNNILYNPILKRGDVDKALEKADFISEHDYYTPFTEHAFMEPECAIGIPKADGIKVISGGQGIYDEYREISEALGLAKEKVEIQSAYVGGGFGGKEDMSVQHHAAIMAFLLKRPVKVLLSRQESINIHPKRHAMYMHFKVGCDKNGKILGTKAQIISDTGAYASLGGPVLERACTHAGGPYYYENVEIEGKAVYTNNPPAGAFRGFGVSQSSFAMESALNELAEKVGISPWEIRFRNAVRPGQPLPNGQIAEQGTAFLETLEACKDYYYNYLNKDQYYVGIASTLKNAGLGVGVEDVGRCNLYIDNGKIHIRSSAAGIGQGIQTVLTQVVCETLNISPEKLIIDHPNTSTTPDSGTTTASRQTVFAGEAARRASLKLKEDLKKYDLKNLDKKLYIGEFSFDSDPLGTKKKNPISHVAYSYATQVAVINKEGKVVKTLAAHDVGKVINPKSIEGQVEGGTLMSMGYALTEDFPLENGIPKVKYGTLGLLRATDVPEIKSVFIEKNNVKLAYGAKGIGEISSIPFVAAIQNAYYNKDGIFRTSLPLKDTFYKKGK